MKKFITILALVSSLGLFTACEDEQITPQALETNDTGGVGGSGTDDRGQWD